MVPSLPALVRKSPLNWIALAAALVLVTMVPRAASAEALLVVEADSGKVLQAENATYPWHPASLSKLMTASTAECLSALAGSCPRGSDAARCRPGPSVRANAVI